MIDPIPVGRYDGACTPVLFLILAPDTLYIKAVKPTKYLKSINTC
ncbi:MAG: hypothetical protein ACE5SW_05775 [Nitrososphaeraceae archaeon]